jgi:DNA-binding MarR family transcriptional regulator
MTANLTPAEAAVLRVVHQLHINDCTARAVANKLFWNTARVSGVLKSLARKGIVEAFQSGTADGTRLYDATPYGDRIRL